MANKRTAKKQEKKAAEKIKKSADIKNKSALTKTSEKSEKNVTKKSVRKTASRKTMKQKLFVQYLGKEIDMDELAKEAKSRWSETGRLIGEIETMEIYVKPEDNAAYVVINGEHRTEISL